MKKIDIIIVFVVALSVMIVLIFNPSDTLSQKKITSQGSSIPDSIMAIFKKSCVGCHGEGGKDVAMSMLNFSSWDTYSKEKQAKKSNAICKALTDGIMPPSSVRAKYPEKIPTTSQIDSICKWSNSLNLK